MSRFRWMLVNAALAAVVIGAVPGLVAVGASVGTALKLGVNNTVTVITKLTATTSTAAMLIKNAGTGTGLDIQVGTGKAPITVSAGAGKATNLDADKLDGKDSTTFQNKIQNLSDLNGVPCLADGSGRTLVATTVNCVSPDTEPNNTIGQALALPPGTQSGLVGTGDIDFYHVSDSVCSNVGQVCIFTVSVAGPGVVFDLYKNDVLAVSNLTSRSVSDPYVLTDVPNLYHVAVHPTGSPAQPLPYIINL